MLRRRKLFYGWWILAVAFVAIWIESGATRWGLSILMKPMTEEMDWTRAEVMGTVTVAGIIGALISPAIGGLVDRYGARASAALACLVAGATLVLTGQIRSLWLFYLVFALGTGLAGPAIGRVSLPTTVANWFVRRRPLAFGILMAATSAGGLIFPSIVQAMETHWGWRMTWLALGLLLILVAAPLTWIIVRRRPEDMGLHPDGDSVAVTQRATAPARLGGIRRRVADVDWTLREAVRTPTFWLLNVALLFTGMPAGAFFLNLHSYLTDQGLTPTTSAWFVSFYAFTAVVIGHPMWAFLSQNFAAHPLLVIYAFYYGAGMVIFGIVGASSPIVLGAALLMVGTGITGGLQLGQLVWADYYGRKSLGSITGVSSFVRVLPATGAPLFAAWIRDVTNSYFLAYMIFGAVCVTAGALLIFARQPQKADTASRR